jgi:hypothetical protein
METLKVHFDELLLAFLLLVLIGVWCWKPDAKEWVGGILAAMIMALRNKYVSEKGETTTETKKSSNTSEEPKGTQ